MNHIPSSITLLTYITTDEGIGLLVFDIIKHINDR